MTDLPFVSAKPAFKPFLSTKRRTEIEFAIVECLALSHAEGKPVALSRYELGKVLHSDPMLSDWLRPATVDDVLSSMVKAKRVVVVHEEGRTLPSYSLPQDPMLAAFGCEAMQEKRRKVAEGIERRIIASLKWPRFFRIPEQDDLLPYVKTRTGYDPKIDFDRF